MSEDLLWAFAVFALVSSVTPGPNNLMLLASGANFGFRRTLPHLAGVVIGFAVMAAAVGLGLGELFARVPALYDIMRWVGATYLLYLAWKIATAAPPDAGSANRARPMGFWAAVAFQWVNPKAWMMAVGAISTYAPAGDPAWIVGLVLLFGLINAPCVAGWAAFGARVGRYLQRPRLRLAFNGTMAVLLVASLVPMVQVG
ncbi:MAG: LysE family translocator [Rhodospirillaceae bacterium]|nr:LysE family translocator [Rhodospirillaceae bacterium]